MKRFLSFFLSLVLVMNAVAEDFTVTIAGDSIGRIVPNGSTATVNANLFLIPKGTTGKLIKVLQDPIGGYALEFEVAKIPSGSGETRIQKGSTLYVPYYGGRLPESDVIEVRNEAGKLVNTPKVGNTGTAKADFQIQSNATHVLPEKAQAATCVPSQNRVLDTKNAQIVSAQIKALQAYQASKVLTLNPVQRIIMQTIAQNQKSVTDPKNPKRLLSTDELYQLNLRTANAVINNTTLFPGKGDDRLPTSLILGMMQTESNYSPTSVSSEGAKGLMQFMKATGTQYNGGKPLDPFDVEGTVKAAVKYVKYLIENKYKGNLQEGLMAYNAGPGKVDRALNEPKKRGKLALKKEALEYPGKILAIKNQYDALFAQTGWIAKN